MLTQAARAGENELRGIIAFGQRFVGVVIKGFAWFILTFMVAAYLLIDVERVMAFLRSLVPPQHRYALDELLREIDRGLSGIIRGQLIICVVNALLTTVGLLLFRVKYAVLLGMLAGTFSFIPVFGSILSSVPIVAVALASGAAAASRCRPGLGMLGWIVGIHLLEANLLNPKIIGTAAKMHPVVVVFALHGRRGVGRAHRRAPGGADRLDRAGYLFVLPAPAAAGGRSAVADFFVTVS